MSGHLTLTATVTVALIRMSARGRKYASDCSENCHSQLLASERQECSL